MQEEAWRLTFIEHLLYARLLFRHLTYIILNPHINTYKDHRNPHYMGENYKGALGITEAYPRLQREWRIQDSHPVHLLPHSTPHPSTSCPHTRAHSTPGSISRSPTRQRPHVGERGRAGVGANEVGGPAVFVCAAAPGAEQTLPRWRTATRQDVFPRGVFYSLPKGTSVASGLS